MLFNCNDLIMNVPSSCSLQSFPFVDASLQSKANIIVEWLWWLCGLGRHTFALLFLLTRLPRPSNKKFKDPQINWKNVQKKFLVNGMLLSENRDAGEDKKKKVGEDRTERNKKEDTTK